jgi:uncharacterized membrane protein YfcA
MELIVIGIVAIGAAALTFFSGFGLGTLLMPAFALWLPVEAAVGATAVVHGTNNVLKLAVVGRHADRAVVLRFGIAAVVMALVGAWVLTLLGDAHVLGTWSWRGEHRVTLVKVVVGCVMIAFAAVELAPGFERLSFPRSWLAWGGAVSGFFGGLSGHQGALRSAFFVRLGLGKEALVATNAWCGAMVDAARLLVYALAVAASGRSDAQAWGGRTWLAIGVGCGAALIGTLVGQRLLKKVTLPMVRRVVGVMLMLLGAAMVAGVV